ncbi:glycosyltransferase family 4 protein [Mucilaginibacter sp. RS28]|uniref:Glycosyltransferase family 4 protein n=1 Tax=Mucilaginibacter straminoryzae TaxID=2932774 RepID=A0A9X2BDH2_9SPHI|nr:glycosyltransferase family 4 protein [Mucilaginibacter straminoryzae]MCJ8210333.1 glycosyltransferase family 4 protein [Mucilaginibacter straminoryzae]
MIFDTNSGGSMFANRRLKVFTWHIHGSYLFYLSQGNYDLYIPTKEDKPEGYYGKGETFHFGPNVHEVPAEEVRSQDFDVILFQSRKNFITDQYEILSAEQRELPKIYLEHDPPQEHPTLTHHIVDDPDMLLVHVTNFNELMWDNNRTPTRVIDHGVIVPQNVRYTGEKERGIVVINNIQRRGRRLGLDVFLKVREQVPLDLVGMGAEELGLGEVKHGQLPDFITKYRFFFNPIRYTSLGLAVCEAMMMGMPIVGLATTEMVTAIDNGVSGIVHTDMNYLIDQMHRLLADRTAAEQLGREAQKTAMERFNIQRFAKDWEDAFNYIVLKRKAPKIILN